MVSLSHTHTCELAGVSVRVLMYYTLFHIADLSKFTVAAGLLRHDKNK